MVGYFNPETSWEALQTNVSEAKLGQDSMEEALKTAVEAKGQKSPHFLESSSNLTFIKPQGKVNQSPYSPLMKINRYLYYLKGSPPDYSVINKVVENAGQSEISDAKIDARLPISIGVVGVLIAVLYAFYQVDFYVDSAGQMMLVIIEIVRIPFVLIITGILFSMILTHVLIRPRIERMEEGKHRFREFLKNHVLPLAGEDIAAVLHRMKGQFDIFNTTFRKNITDFETAMGTINENVVRQGDFLSKLDKLDLEEIANTNINIFRKLDRIMGEFDKFTGLMQQLNDNVENASELERRLERLTASADNINLSIKRVGEEVDNKLHLSTEMLRFLKSHFTEMDERKAIITRAVINFDNFLNKSFDQLERHAMERVNSIKDIKIKEEDKLIKALESSRSGLQNLENLEKMLEELRMTNQLLQELIHKS